MNTGTLVGSLIMAAVVVVVIALLMQAMMRGWRRRAERQAALISTLPPLPDSVGSALISGMTGLYVGSTLVPNWNDRVAAGDLGYRTKAVLTRYPEGIMLQRSGGHPIWIPDDSIVDIRSDKALAGKVIAADAILTIRWRLPSGIELDTGFRGDDRSQYGRWLGEES